MNSPTLSTPQPDPQRLAIQRDLQLTQFYKGRVDGYPDDERMDAAIKLVQIAAHLPVTGYYSDAVRDAIARNGTTGDYKKKDVPSVPIDLPTPKPTSLPGGTTSSSSSSTALRPRNSLLHDLATFAILTSPAWGTLLLLNRPWTKLPLRGRLAR